MKQSDLLNIEIEDLLEEGDGLFSFDAELWELAKRVSFQGWSERQVSRGLPTPSDMSGSCKFGSLFIRILFGGHICGHEDHQFVIQNSRILDFSSDSKDVQSLKNPYHHDSKFWANQDHIESLESCLPRVLTWVDQFCKAIGPAKPSRHHPVSEETPAL